MEGMLILNQDQHAILETVARFARNEVAPRAARLDANQNPLDCHSWEIVERAHELGIRTMSLDERWGSLRVNSLTTAMVVEELGKAALGVSVIMVQTFKITQIMQHAPNLAGDPHGLFAIDMFEPGSSSDKHSSIPALFATSASRTAPNASCSRTVSFRTRMWSAKSASPPPCLPTSRRSRMHMPALRCSASKWCRQKAVEWTKLRVQGSIRAQLGDMRMLIDASRSYIHRTAWLADHREQGWDPTLGTLPKAMAAQTALKIAT